MTEYKYGEITVRINTEYVKTGVELESLLEKLQMKRPPTERTT